MYPIGLNPDNTLPAPSGANRRLAAWYNGSPAPGQPGPTLIEAHRDFAGGERGIFYRLPELKPGQPVVVTTAAGRKLTYQVYKVRDYPKSAFPAQTVYGYTPRPELRLITCGGSIGSDGHWDSNTVVWATMSRS